MLEQQTWVTLLGFAGFGLAMMTYLATMKRDLKAEIGSVRTDLKADIGGVRTDLKADISDLKTDIARVDGRLTTLENRTYDISLRLPPAPASAPHSP